MLSFSFDKKYRLLTRADFLSMKKGSKRFNSFFFDVIVRPNNKDIPRLGIVASKRFGGSVERNLFKRIVRDSFRISKVNLSNFDFLIIAKRKDSERENNSVECTRQSLDIFFKKYSVNVS